MVGPADLPLILVVAVALFSKFNKNLSISRTFFLYLPPLRGRLCCPFRSLHYSLTLSYILFFYPLLPSFFYASSDPSYVISFIRSFRSFCLRISVFHNSLSPPLPLSSPFEFNHKIPLYYGTGPSLSLSPLLFHPYIPLPNLRKVHFACHSYRLPEQ